MLEEGLGRNGRCLLDEVEPGGKRVEDASWQTRWCERREKGERRLNVTRCTRLENKRAG